MDQPPALRHNPTAFFAHHWRWVLGIAATALVVLMLASSLTSNTTAKIEGVSNQTCAQAVASLVTFTTNSSSTALTTSPAAATQYQLLTSSVDAHCSPGQATLINQSVIQPWLSSHTAPGPQSTTHP